MWHRHNALEMLLLLPTFQQDRHPRLKDAQQHSQRQQSPGHGYEYSSQRYAAVGGTGYLPQHVPPFGATLTANHVTNIFVTIFFSTGKIGMAGANTSYRFSRRFDGSRAHTLFPVYPVEIFNLHSNRRTESLSITHAREKTNGVFLNLHAPSTTITSLPPAQVSVNQRCVY